MQLSSAVNPNEILKVDITALKNCFVRMTRNNTSTKLIPLACGEKAQLECSDLLKELTGTEFKNTPLDQYWFGKLVSYPNLKQFVACVLSLSHGQAFVEREFSHQKKNKISSTSPISTS